MKQTDSLSGRRIDRSDIAPFAAIAKYAGICQIVEIGRAAVLAADDMIDLVAKPHVVFVDETILATISSPTGYFGAALLIDFTAHAKGSGEPLLWPF